MPTLQVEVVEGKDLAKTDILKNPDPYVRISWNDFHVETPVCKRTLNPVWNFSCKVPISDPNAGRLKFEVFDRDRIGHDDPMGAASCPLGQMQYGKWFDSWVPIQKGRIHLRLFPIDFGVGMPVAHAHVVPAPVHVHPPPPVDCHSSSSSSSCCAPPPVPYVPPPAPYVPPPAPAPAPPPPQPVYVRPPPDERLRAEYRRAKLRHSQLRLEHEMALQDLVLRRELQAERLREVEARERAVEAKQRALAALLAERRCVVAPPPPPPPQQRMVHEYVYEVGDDGRERLVEELHHHPNASGYGHHHHHSVAPTVRPRTRRAARPARSRLAIAAPPAAGTVSRLSGGGSVAWGGASTYGGSWADRAAGYDAYRSEIAAARAADSRLAF